MRLLREATRHAIRRPALPLAMAALLAIGLAAATALFAYVNTTALRPLPYPFAARLVTASIGARVWSPAMLDAVETANTTFDRIVAVHERAVHLQGIGGPATARLEAVSPAYFEVFGIAPALGHPFTRGDDRGAASVCLISHALWRQQFGSDPGVLGRELVLDGSPVRIVGVLPPGVRGLIGRTDVWIPVGLAPRLGSAGDPPPSRPFSRWFEVVGRIRPDLSLAQAEASFSIEAARAMGTIPGSDLALGPRWRTTLRPLQAAASDPRATAAASFLLAAVLLVLMLASLNFAGLHLAATASRARELEVRRAVGASTADLASMIAAEAAIPVLAGMAGGWFFSRTLMRVVLALRPDPTGFGIATADLAAIGIDAFDMRVGLMHGVVAFSCWGMAVGPAMARVIRDGCTPGIRGASRGSAALPALGRLNTGAALMVLQTAFCVVLVGATGLALRTASNLWTADRGIDARSVQTLRLVLPEREADGERLASLLPDLARRAASIAGVEGASISNCAPGAGRCRRTSVREVDGRALPASQAPTVGVHFVTPDHFAVVSTPLVAGRPFAETDRRGAPPVVIVSESLARRLWGTTDAAGHRLALHFADGRHTQPREVAGVVRDVVFDARERGPQLDVYVPAAQVAWSSALLFVRSDRPLPTRQVRDAVGDLDSHLAVGDSKPLAASLARGFAPELFLAKVLTAFAGAALLLAGIGIYARVSHAVLQERRDMAVRLAIGATGWRVAASMLARAGQPVLSGIVIGTGIVLWAGQVLASVLFDVSPRDPLSLGAAAALMAIVAAAAVLVPARRVLRLHPSAVLREV